MTPTSSKAKTQGKKAQPRSRAAKAWLTLGTVAAYAAVSISRPTVIWAQAVDPSKAGGKAQEGQGLTVRRLNIPEGALDATITAYEQLTGIQVTFSIPSETVAGFRSPGANGLYTEDQALRAILAGTGLSYQIDNTGRVTDLRTG